MMNNLFLFQLNDSNFPIGSFSHSYGFETYMLQDKIVDQKSFEAWLYQFMENEIITSEGLAVKLVYQAIEKNNLSQVLIINQELNAQLLASEMRLANQKMGKQFLKIGQELIKDDLLADYQAQTKAQNIAPHPAVVYTLLAFSSGVSQEQTIAAYLLNMVTSLVQNAVRGVPLGQIAGQKIIFSYQKNILRWVREILRMNPRVFGAVALGIEIAQMQHEFLFARNFMS